MPFSLRGSYNTIGSKYTILYFGRVELYPIANDRGIAGSILYKIFALWIVVSVIVITPSLFKVVKMLAAFPGKRLRC
jgi:hypothetical protein